MEQKVNYIKAHKAIQLLTKNDIELRPIHKSMIDAIFMYWNAKEWAELFNIDRDSLMEYSKVSNRKTYYETLSFLQEREYIVYKPSKNPDIASVFGMGKKVTSAITSDGLSAIPSAIPSGITSGITSDGTSGGTIYINIQTIKPKTLKLINDNATLIEQCLESWIVEHNKADDSEFEIVWALYGRKGNKQSSKKKWAKVKETEVDSIKLHIPLYLKSISDRKYLKDFENYLNTEHWKSVIDNSKPQIKRLHNHGIPVN